jgi:hypothetical protein
MVVPTASLDWTHVSILEGGGMIMVLIEDFATVQSWNQTENALADSSRLSRTFIDGGQELRMLKAILNAKLPRTCI